ncbi:hypothetical protein ACT453_53435, partial [Bacillus sp. D-CC]
MFWRLANKYPEIPFVPTEELDEVWHLHMLYPQNYYPDCKKYFNGLLHHYTGSGAKNRNDLKVFFQNRLYWYYYLKK